MSNYESHIRVVEDFPKQGINFYDIAPLIGESAVFKGAVNEMAEPLVGNITKVVAFDARGFVFGSSVATEADAGLVMLRKPGKLPGLVLSEKYKLEYGEAELELQEGVLTEDDVVVLIDDVIATGGTALAGIKLVQKTKATIKEFCSLIDLEELGGSRRINEVGVAVRSLIKIGERA